MRWVAWVVLVSACAKPSGGTLTPTPAASEAPALGSAAPSTPPPEAQTIPSTVPVEALPALPSASAVGEKPRGTATASSKRESCLVKVGELEIIRPCQGKPNERKAPTSKAATLNTKMCEHVEHTAGGDLVSVRPCPE